MPEIDTWQGELRIGRIIHGAALNCMIVPYDEPEQWFFQQFPRKEDAVAFAEEHNLLIVERNDERDNSAERE